MHSADRYPTTITDCCQQLSSCVTNILYHEYLFEFIIYIHDLESAHEPTSQHYLVMMITRCIVEQISVDIFKYLTHFDTLRPNKMADTLHTTFSNTFSWTKIIVLDSNFIAVCAQKFNDQ